MLFRRRQSASTHSYDDAATRLEPISPINPQRPTKRREAVAEAKRVVAEARERRKRLAGKEDGSK